jgi:hypothetical protein
MFPVLRPHPAMLVAPKEPALHCTLIMSNTFCERRLYMLLAGTKTGVKSNGLCRISDQLFGMNRALVESRVEECGFLLRKPRMKVHGYGLNKYQ